VRPLGGKWRLSVEKVGECDVVSRHLQGCSPRLCRLRTDGLAPMSKYWMYRSYAGDMGPVSLVVSRQQKVGFAPTASLVGLWEKLDTDPWIGQPSCYGLCQEQWPCSTLLMTTWKVAIIGPCEIRMVKGYTRTEREKCMACWSGFPLQGVHRFESPRLSDMSTTCLCQSSRR
jgi:hypothetical protein